MKKTLLDGEILTMTNLHQAYKDIWSANCVKQPDCTRKKVKVLIENEIPGVEYYIPKQKSKSALVSLKSNRDVAVQVVSESQRQYFS